MCYVQFYSYTLLGMNPMFVGQPEKDTFQSLAHVYETQITYLTSEETHLVAQVMYHSPTKGWAMGQKVLKLPSCDDVGIRIHQSLTQRLILATKQESSISHDMTFPENRVRLLPPLR